MAEEIKIKKKVTERGDDGYKIVSVRMKDELLDRLDRLSADTNRSRNELINLLCDDQHFIVTAAVEISPPFFAWIATFGRRVKILSPEPVVEKMRDFLQRSMDMYKEDGEK